MPNTDIKSIFQSKYSSANWKQLLNTLFPGQGLNLKPVDKKDPSLKKHEDANAILELGVLEIPFDGKHPAKIAIYEVQLKKGKAVTRNRVGLRNILQHEVVPGDVDAVLASFYSEGSRDWRLTLISKSVSWDFENNKEEWETQPKRYTYVLGEGEKVKTPETRLASLFGKSFSLEDLRTAFSVSALTKEFYNELFKWYEWTLSEEVGITFPKNSNTPDDDREKIEEQIIRLITRLLFVWFIKQKDLVPNDLFDVTKLQKILKDFNPNDRKSGNYYNAILQNLFFATLNKTVTERSFAKETNNRDIKTLYRYADMFSIKEKEVLELFRPIPFLNGGLFECLDKDTAMDGVKYHLDGFSRNDRKVKGRYSHRAFIPNCVFFDEHKGIIPLLDRYNFTVEENAPEDVQVALDPELLGNVFENLLGAFNNETKESARKQSGSFYTPREIVDFMVSESLQAYLKEKIGDVDINGKLTDAQKKKIYDTLLKVKILDPACGSGAFPMGILNGIIAMLEKIGVAEKLDMYKLKLHLIENCIYGVDLQTIASQISKLRFFISLIVEQKEKDLSKENYGVITLPNLETKFVAANTLIGLHKKKAGDFTGNLFEDPRIETTKQQILGVRHEHFYAQTAKDKRQLREKDARLRNELVELLENNHEFAPEDAKQVAQWNPYDQNSSSSFFDIEWMFGVKDGFDIVIGNPPYVQLQKDGGRLAKMFEKVGYTTFERTGDIYSLFYEKGTELLKHKGHLCFITSNKWMRAGYGESTRLFFAENTNPLLLVDFAGQKIFDAATVDTSILLLSKERNLQKTRACVVKDKVLNNLSVFVRQSGSFCAFANASSWVILSDIEQRIKEKIERIGRPLRDWDVQINYGIKTGFNEAFIIDGEKRKELIAQDPKSEEIIRPILRGRDIKRYGYDFADLWLINTHNGIKEKGVKPINVNDYHAIKKHLDAFYPELVKRADKGDTPYNLRNCAYMEDFNRQKIIWIELADKGRFAIDNKDNYITLNGTFIMIGNDLEYIACILNNPITSWHFNTYCISSGVGTNQWREHYVKELFIPDIPKKEQIPLINQVNKILELRKRNKSTGEEEKKLDQMVYTILQLDSEQINFIESQ